ncbi:MAG: hypothetical protein IJL78_03605 [Lachnospiraceae bacterium]|nr:hypothetical protein [Lachnospiraceae bacterium]
MNENAGTICIDIKGSVHKMYMFKNLVTKNPEVFRRKLLISASADDTVRPSSRQPAEMYSSKALPAYGKKQKMLEAKTFWEWRVGMRKGCYITDISSRGQKAPHEEEEMEFFTWLYKDMLTELKVHRRAYVNGKRSYGQITKGAEDGGPHALKQYPRKCFESARTSRVSVSSRKNKRTARLGKE